MLRSCRIGGDELNIYLFALAEVGAAVVAALLADIHENLRIEAVGETEVYESRDPAASQDENAVPSRSMFFVIAAAIIAGARLKALSHAMAAFVE